MPLDHDDHKIDASENVGVNPSTEPAIGEVIARRLSRRDAIKALTATTALASAGALAMSDAAHAAGPSSLRFRELAHGYDETHHVAEGYDAQVLIR